MTSSRELERWLSRRAILVGAAAMGASLRAAAFAHRRDARPPSQGYLSRFVAAIRVPDGVPGPVAFNDQLRELEGLFGPMVRKPAAAFGVLS